MTPRVAKIRGCVFSTSIQTVSIRRRLRSGARLVCFSTGFQSQVEPCCGYQNPHRKADPMHSITYETSYYQRLKQQLVAEHSDIDEETLADTLEGLTELNEILAATIRSALEDETLCEALKARLDCLRERKDRIQQRARNKRIACARALAEAGLKKIVAPDMTISLRPNSSRVLIVDEGRIPPQFWRTPDPVLSRRELSDALKSGGVVPGAQLEAGEPSLTVRVK